MKELFVPKLNPYDLRNINSFHEQPLTNVLQKQMFLKGLQLYDKETPAQVFSCEICEIVKNIFNYRTPLVTASIITEKKSKFCLEWH